MDEETRPTPRENDAHMYLKQHRILELFDNMTSMLIYNQPEEMKPFLIKQLEKLKTSKLSGMYHPCLFDDTNLQAIFGMLDVTKQGFISKEQYCEALKTIGAAEFQSHPSGSEIDKITLDTFMHEAKKGLHNATATFKI